MKTLLFTILTLTTISISLSSCECRGMKEKNCSCFTVFDPVCGCDEQTYGNSCEASCNGIKSWTEGACQ